MLNENKSSLREIIEGLLILNRYLLLRFIFFNVIGHPTVFSFLESAMLESKTLMYSGFRPGQSGHRKGGIRVQRQSLTYQKLV